MFGLQHSCNISRRKTVSSNGGRAQSVIHTGVACLAIPMSAQATIQNRFELGRGYEFFFNSGQDVKVGDQLIYNGSTYSVKAKQDYLVPVVGHVHVMAEQEIS